jgi:hypothetical protein
MLSRPRQIRAPGSVRLCDGSAALEHRAIVVTAGTLNPDHMASLRRMVLSLKCKQSSTPWLMDLFLRCSSLALDKVGTASHWECFGSPPAVARLARYLLPWAWYMLLPSPTPPSLASEYFQPRHSFEYLYTSGVVEYPKRKARKSTQRSRLM